MMIKRLLFGCMLSFFAICHAAEINQSPVDLWRTYDLKGQERSVLKFYIADNELKADVVKILLNKGVYCDKCKRNLKNKPYLGMTIIRGLTHKQNKWINGEVLDTDTGNTYSCHVTLSKDGKTMNLHAYKGIPLFGRTVHWQRESEIH